MQVENDKGSDVETFDGEEVQQSSASLTHFQIQKRQRSSLRLEE